MTRYRVTYGRAGCPTDAQPMYFHTLENAVEYVRVEHRITLLDIIDDDIDAEIAAGRMEESERAHFEGFDPDGELDADEIAAAMGADNPTDGSLYRWSIEPIE